jgi:hypothetical protein
LNPAQLECRGILAGGNWIVDRPKIIDVYPVQDSLANILRETSSNGGGPYNVLIDLARLQVPFPLFALGLVGDDPAGEFIRRDLGYLLLLDRLDQPDPKYGTVTASLLARAIAGLQDQR